MMDNRNNARKTSPVSLMIALVAVAIVAVFLHSGNIKVDFKDTSVKLSAPFWTDLEIKYSEIDAVTYRNDFDIGKRAVGVGSARLSVGKFQNEEFGSYTLYAYTDSTEYIVLASDGKTVVIGMQGAKDAETIYNTLKERTEN